MIAFLLALLAALATIAVVEGWVIVGFLFAAGAVDQDPTTVDLEDAPVFAIDSAGRAYEAVAVKDCNTCGQTLPTDHQCTGYISDSDERLAWMLANAPEHVRQNWGPTA